MAVEFLNVDCMDYMATLPDKYFQLSIVDVPYGIKEDGRQRQHRDFKSDGSRRITVDKRNGRAAAIKTNTYKVGDWDNKYPNQDYFDELFRVSKKHIIWGSNYINFDQKLLSSGRIFWDKVMPDNDFSDGEIAWTNLHKGVRQIEYMWNGMLQGKSLNEGRVVNGSQLTRETRIHPTQKPVALYKWLLHNYAKPGDRILDTHGGSMSSAIAAEHMGFDMTICELDKDYFDAGVKRFKEQTQQIQMFKQNFNPHDIHNGEGGQVFNQVDI